MPVTVARTPPKAGGATEFSSIPGAITVCTWLLSSQPLVAESSGPDRTQTHGCRRWRTSSRSPRFTAPTISPPCRRSAASTATSTSAAAALCTSPMHITATARELQPFFDTHYHILLAMGRRHSLAETLTRVNQLCAVLGETVARTLGSTCPYPESLEVGCVSSTPRSSCHWLAADRTSAFLPFADIAQKSRSTSRSARPVRLRHLRRAICAADSTAH